MQEREKKMREEKKRKKKKEDDRKKESNDLNKRGEAGFTVQDWCNLIGWDAREVQELRMGRGRSFSDIKLGVPLSLLMPPPPLLPSRLLLAESATRSVGKPPARGCCCAGTGYRHRHGHGHRHRH